MSAKIKFVCLGLTALISTGFDASARLEISASISINSPQDFDQPLASYGGWVNYGGYGRCWHPREVSPGWRPYCNGQWVWTDCGWYWQSEEPWAWACYHYGQWVDDPTSGWYWVPGVDWAPAWVVWRVGGGYVGWAPCAPSGVTLAPGYFGFVAVGHFNEPIRPSSLVVNNTTIIAHTTYINNVRQVTRNLQGSSRRVVVNEGPGVGVIQKATGRSFSPTPIQEVVRRDPTPTFRTRGEQPSTVPERTVPERSSGYQRENPAYQRGTPPNYENQGKSRQEPRTETPQARPERAPVPQTYQEKRPSQPTRTEEPSRLTPAEEHPSGANREQPSKVAPSERPLERQVSPPNEKRAPERAAPAAEPSKPPKQPPEEKKKEGQ